jgi:hypothetical protein
MSYRGRAITPDQARQWWRERPMLAPPSDSPVATVYFNPASATPPKE